MTAHELAHHLLTLENLPVIINGWGSGEGSEYEVTEGTRDDWRALWDGDGKPTSAGQVIPCIALLTGQLSVWEERIKTSTTQPPKRSAELTVRATEQC